MQRKRVALLMWLAEKLASLSNKCLGSAWGFFPTNEKGENQVRYKILAGPLSFHFSAPEPKTYSDLSTNIKSGLHLLDALDKMRKNDKQQPTIG
ncbi:hypothetical protein [Methylobacillus sp.]|uniref:hypothetical protein n=1 Tax=Methylobacillus sp. TaxID=56818 RepID=UPI00257ABCBB|nr:hypothetical protein [Methylobacillus sp.]